MFKKLLNAIFKKGSSKKSSKNKKGEVKNMADVKDVKDEVVEEQKTETKNESVAENANKGAEEVKETEKDNEKKEEVVDNKEENAEPAQEGTAQVQSTEPEGNGVRVEDLVTKDMLADRLAALEAKFDAVVKENEDLKNTVAGMKEKYEDKDFGNTQKAGMMNADKKANDNFYESFAEYSKQFM